MPKGLQQVVVVVVGSLRTACSNEDYCSPVLGLGAKQGTPSPLTFKDRKDGKVFLACYFL